MTLTAKVGQAFWWRLIWPAPPSFLRGPLLLGVAFDTFTLLLSVVSQVFTLREGPGFLGL